MTNRLCTQANLVLDVLFSAVLSSQMTLTYTQLTKKKQKTKKIKQKSKN